MQVVLGVATEIAYALVILAAALVLSLAAARLS